MLNYLYKSEELDNALQDIFGEEETLFGCRAINKQAPNKVAVVATGEEDDKSLLLTNYNREWLTNDDQSTLFSPLPLNYVLTHVGNNLRREERPNEELKIWEV